MAASEVVPFLSMPSCAFQHCVKDNSSALPCTTLTTPCGFLLTATPTTGGSAELPATTVTDSNSLCTTVPLSCYCNLASPLQCAWEPCRKTNTDAPGAWLLAENWFNAICPNGSSIPFDSGAPNSKSLIPACARQCLQDRAFDSGCIIEKKLCFCPHRSLFNCAAGCNDAENATIASWYASACAVSLVDATAALRAIDDSQPVIPAKEPWSGFNWYEILVLVVFGLIVGVGLFYLAVRERLRKFHQKHVAQKKRH